MVWVSFADPAAAGTGGTGRHRAAPGGTGRHRAARPARPAPGGTGRHRAAWPAPGGTGRHRAAWLCNMSNDIGCECHERGQL